MDSAYKNGEYNSEKLEVGSQHGGGRRWEEETPIKIVSNYFSVAPSTAMSSLPFSSVSLFKCSLSLDMSCSNCSMRLFDAAIADLRRSAVAFLFSRFLL